MQVLNLLDLTPPVLEAVAAFGDPLPPGLVSEHRLHRLAKFSTEEQIQGLQQASLCPWPEPM